MPVISLVITSSESVITTQNSIKTLKTLEAISAQTQKPVIMWSAHNQSISRVENDANARAIISFIAILCSRQVAEMDSRDIANWLQYDRTTTTKPCLSMLHPILETNAEEWSEIVPLSVASIYPNPDAPTINAIPEYQCVGYADLSGHSIQALHLAIDVETPRRLTAELNSAYQNMVKERDSRVQPKSILDQADKADENGLIL